MVQYIIDSIQANEEQETYRKPIKSNLWEKNCSKITKHRIKRNLASACIKAFRSKVSLNMQAILIPRRNPCKHQNITLPSSEVCNPILKAARQGVQAI